MRVPDSDLRMLVREAIARHVPTGAESGPGPTQSDLPGTFSSHSRFLLVPGGGDGPCLIEPTVRCNHCGYCQTYGH
jgi:hypothetical protein